MIEQGVIAASDSVVSIVLSVAGTLISIVSIVISIYVARKYGDVAGAARMIQYEQERIEQARIAMLQSLINEVARIRKVIEHNSQSEPALRVPTSAFETAFISGQSGLVPSQELLSAVADYLTCADTINTWIEIHSVTMLGTHEAAKTQAIDALLKVKRLCTDGVPFILNRLENTLQGELDKETKVLRRRSSCKETL
jgi:hypothetical protein